MPLFILKGSINYMEVLNSNKLVAIKKDKSIQFLMILIAGSLTLLSFALLSNNKKHKSANTIEKGFAVVELFTSEGCSSCPAADAAIAELLSKQIKDVFILSYHVDYWNRLGWKDEFSQHQFSERQQQYARHLSLEGVYTPQVVVNGTTEFVGSNEAALNNAINNGTINGTQTNLKITAERKNNTAIVSYNITGNETVLLNTAVVLPEAESKVKRGENGGKTLHHVNIVSSLKVAELKGTGELTVAIPKQLTGKPIKIIAYTQAKQSLKVLGADEVKL
jgi:hypothetical protein